MKDDKQTAGWVEVISRMGRSRFRPYPKAKKISQSPEVPLAEAVGMQLGFIEDELQKLGSSESAKSIRYRLDRIKELVK